MFEVSAEEKVALNSWKKRAPHLHKFLTTILLNSNCLDMSCDLDWEVDDELDDLTSLVT